MFISAGVFGTSTLALLFRPWRMLLGLLPLQRNQQQRFKRHKLGFFLSASVQLFIVGVAAATTANTGNSAERKHFKPSRHIQTHFEQKIKKKNTVCFQSRCSRCVYQWFSYPSVTKDITDFFVFIFLFGGGGQHWDQAVNSTEIHYHHPPTITSTATLCIYSTP